MSLAKFVRAFTLVVLMISMFAHLAQAGMPHRDCRFPMVFDGAAVNVVVLPYTYAGSDYALSDLGTRLSLLVKLDVLSHILDYGSVGAVQMEMPEGVRTTDRSCQPETVLAKLLGDSQGPVIALRPRHGLVLVWGLMYEEGDDIFVQTYARFLRRDIDETITLQSAGFSFSAKLTSQMVAFTPQKFTRNELRRIEDSYQRADYVHDQPNDSSRADRLPQLVAKCYGLGCDDSPVHAGFYVEEKRGEWIRIQYMDPIRDQRKQGWIHAAGGLSGVPLDKFLPELHFIEGCAGYLRLRVGEAEQMPPPPTLAALAVEQLSAFVESNEQPTDVTNAVALQLAGAVQYLSGRNQPESLAGAANLFERARAIVPYDSNAITLAVGAQTAEEFQKQGRVERTAIKAQQLSAAIALGSDKAALSNLNSFYSLLLKMPDASGTAGNLSRQVIKERVDNLKRISIVPK
jgi:hypothetical protein